jgi:hypothetical protein
MIRLLEQATDLDEFGLPTNFLSEYVMSPHGIMMAGNDEDAIKLVHQKLDELNALRSEKQEPQEIKSPSASVKTVISSTIYGPQHPIHPETTQIHPAYNERAVNLSL